MLWNRFIVYVAALLIAGCHAGNVRYQNSSIMEYLYSDTEQKKVEAGIPILRLPLSVGIAFTPGNTIQSNGLTEDKKTKLLHEIGSYFQAMDFVKSIEVIPSPYLSTGGGFDNLDQLKRMFGVDVIALVSYDQTTFNAQNFAAITYWTIVGAYIIPAEKNTTHTMLDAVLYDIESRKLMFRAPGTSSVKSSSTLIGQQEQAREDALKGFDLASVDLVENLTRELTAFRAKVRQSPEQYRVVKSEGYQGSGTTGIGFLILLGLVLFRVFRHE